MSAYFLSFGSQRSINLPYWKRATSVINIVQTETKLSVFYDNLDINLGTN